MIEIPQSYTISKFYSHANKPRQIGDYLNGGCPICHEGNSWNVKQRLFYYLRDDFLYCYNCARSWNPYWWVKEVTGKSFKEIKEDLSDYCSDDFVLQWDRDQFSSNTVTIPDLPDNCVNLKDQIQLKYYKDNKIVKKALNYCQKRRLFTAVNSPKNLYVCLNDKYHKNRLIIPFYKNNRIDCYTSRRLLDDDTPKYLLKFNSPKSVFNFDKIKSEIPYIFLFEGQIDSMFVENGVAVSGLTLTTEQEDDLSAFPFHEKIWILDNPKFEKKEVVNKIMEKIRKGDKLFFYKNEFEKFKDLNDYCVAKSLDKVSVETILENSFSGEKALLKL